MRCMALHACNACFGEGAKAPFAPEAFRCSGVLLSGRVAKTPTLMGKPTPADPRRPCHKPTPGWGEIHPKSNYFLKRFFGRIF